VSRGQRGGSPTVVAACVVPSSPIFVTLMKEAPVPPKRLFLQEPHGVTTQKTPFFIVTAVKTSNLTNTYCVRSSRNNSTQSLQLVQ
jgi:hypothetical protein